MANTAAHVVDRIIPAVPVRQWVLSLPFDVRATAAYDAAFLSAIVRAFASALRDRHQAVARAAGVDTSEFAAITFVQRFGSSLNLNVHLHVVVVDGVFSRDPAGSLLFTPAPPPSAHEMLAAIHGVRARVAKLGTAAVAVPAPLAACAQLALARGELRAVTAALEEEGDSPLEPRREGAAVDEAGYNLEASVRVDAENDFSREHLLRYCARPPVALSRLVALPANKLGYRIKKLQNGRSKLRVMTPLELLARLAALVPPPRHPLVRFHGALTRWMQSTTQCPLRPDLACPAGG